MKKAAVKPENMGQLMMAVKEYIEDLIFSEEEGKGEKRGGRDKFDLQKFCKQKGRLRQALHRCSLGSEKDRLFVREFIKEIISEVLGLSEKELFMLLPVKQEDGLSAQDCFEILIYSYMRRCGEEGFMRMCEDYNLPAFYRDSPRAKQRDKGNGNRKGTADTGEGYEISEAEIRKIMRAEVLQFTYPDLLEILAQRVYQELYGFSFCDRLISKELAVDGVSAGNHAVYVMLKGKKVRLSFLGFESENALARVVRKLARNHPKVQLSRRNCAMVLGLLNNVRVTVARPPAAEGWNFYVRKFNTIKAGEPEALLTDKNASFAISLLRILVKGCVNLVITGEQASGKTTLLKALVGFIDGRYSIRLAEGALEMHLGELYPNRNILTIQEHGELQLREILSLFKKTDTDVTICGEINEPQTAEAFVQIAQSGGRFTMCTSHHNTTVRLISYMRNALLKGAGFASEQIATEQVVEALNFDIHMETDKSGHRYIERITEIEREETKGYKLREILVFSDGEYRQAGCIGEEHKRRICGAYEGWRGEEAAGVLTGWEENVSEI